MISKHDLKFSHSSNSLPLAPVLAISPTYAPSSLSILPLFLLSLMVQYITSALWNLFLGALKQLCSFCEMMLGEIPIVKSGTHDGKSNVFRKALSCTNESSPRTGVWSIRYSATSVKVRQAY